ncbi:S-adenosyl-L-methionine-dependent methyltransferase, partial [Bimuria novae-zelandiae CBS 107.79]
EVGVGTGSMTRSILAALQSFEKDGGQTRFAEYVFTDVSPSFFKDAREIFDKFRDRMLFKTLDLQEDLPSQGFDDASYDLILAGSVLHITSDLLVTLRRLRR